MTDPLVRLSGIGKAYGPVPACRDVSLDLFPGEVLGLVGENGAGKSTLVHILSGVVQPDAGSMSVNSRPILVLTPARAQGLGIVTVYQSFQLIPDLTVLENIILGAEPRCWGLFVDRKTARRKISELIDRFPLGDLPLDLPVRHLEAGYRQYVEVLRALYREPDLVILDEPTALMPPNFVGPFLALIKALSASGKSIVLVSHRLDEVIAVADRVAMLRRGELLGVLEPPFTLQDLVARLDWMDRIGVDAQASVAAAALETAEVLVYADDLTLDNADDGVSLRDLSFTVRRGDLVGLLGATGNGQQELVDLLVGLRQPDTGELRFNAVTGGYSPPVSLVRRAYIPTDTAGRGLAMQLDLVRNLMLGYHRTPEWHSWWGLRWSRIETWCQRLVKQYSIRTQGCQESLADLSGGTRQKVVVARELVRGPVLLVAEYPFKGLDLTTRDVVANEFRRFAAAGGGVLLVDSDAETVRVLCNRIYILWRGRIRTATGPPFPPNQELLGLMVGVGWT